MAVIETLARTLGLSGDSHRNYPRIRLHFDGDAGGAAHDRVRMAEFERGCGWAVARKAPWPLAVAKIAKVGSRWH
jgi:hypothetical protein